MAEPDSKKAKNWAIRSQASDLIFNLKKQYFRNGMDIKSYITQKQRTNIPTIGKLGRLSNRDLTRIINKIEGNPSTNECWLWNAGIDWRSGKGCCHGDIWYNGKHVKTHRIMYHNFIGDVPEYDHNSIDLIVLHKCSHLNDGRCVNPTHLKLGTPKENMMDAMNSNTFPTGYIENHPNRKFSNIQIQEIRDLKGTGISRKEISKIYGMSVSQISNYWNNKYRKLKE